MKLIHVASSYPLSESDGTAPFMAEMLEALASRGHMVTALIPRVQGLAEGERNGVRVFGAPYAPSSLQVWGYGRSLGREGRLRPSAAALTPLALASLGRLLRSQVARISPDVVHLHWVLPQGALASVVPKTLPLVVSAHGADARLVAGRLKPIARLVLARADAIVAASAEILDLITQGAQELQGKCHVIPHGADDTLFGARDARAAREALGVDPREKVVLGVGRLVKKKGFRHLISAMEFIPDPLVKLYMVGEGPERPNLIALANENQRGRVHLMGQLTRDAVADWFAAADVVVIPSIASRNDVDSGPVVLVEAMAAGKPVVSTRIGMAPDLIEDGVNGLLVASASPRELGEALATALRHREELGFAARRTFERLGGWGRVADDLEMVYANTINRRRAATR